jgi:hypothetical protein
MIFDIPSLVAEGDDPTGGDEMERKRGYPDPVAEEWIVFAIQFAVSLNVFRANGRLAPEH